MRHTLLAIQMFYPLPHTEPLRQALQALVQRAPDGASIQDKSAFFRAVVDTLMPWMTFAARGVWDYVEDAERADEEYRSWAEGTVRDAVEPKPEAAMAEGAYREGGRFMFVTLLFLVKKGSNTDTTICERCRMPEETFFARASLQHILSGIPLFNFATVRGDAVYVRPGDANHGITEAELGEEHYGYVRAFT